MANVKVNLLKRVKVTGPFTQEHLSQLSSLGSTEGFQALQDNREKAPWRFCAVFTDARGQFDLGRVKRPGFSFKTRVGGAETMRRKWLRLRSLRRPVW